MRSYVAELQRPKRNGRRFREVLEGDPGSEGALWMFWWGMRFSDVESPTEEDNVFEEGRFYNVKMGEINCERCGAYLTEKPDVQ